MSFAETGYAKLSLLGDDYCRALTDQWHQNAHLHERWPDMPGIKRTSANNLPMMRLLHEATVPLVQEIVGEPIKASYSFTSCYEKGSSLPPHTDRSQCKYNVTLMLDPAPDWLLHIKRAGTEHAISLDVGEAVIYSGTKDLHWRNAMPQKHNSVLGVFFHYVPQNFVGSLD